MSFSGSKSKTPIFVVSMATAADRRAAFQKRAENAALSWNFFDAKQALSDDLVYDEREALFFSGRTLGSGELGCYASHYALWKRLLQDDENQQYIIIEDDVIVDWTALAMLSELDMTRSDVNYLRLYHKRPSEFIVRAPEYLSYSMSLIELFGKAFGTQAYLINKRGAKVFIDYCRHVTRPIDTQMDRFWDHGVPNLCIFPFPAIEGAIPSSIGSERFETKHRPTWRRRLYVRIDRMRRQAAAFKRARRSQEWAVRLFSATGQAAD